MLRVLNPPAMIRYFIDANKLERQQLDFKMDETDDPRNYEILSNFFEAHNCTDYHTIPIVISEDEEEAVPAEEVVNLDVMQTASKYFSKRKKMNSDSLSP